MIDLLRPFNSERSCVYPRTPCVQIDFTWSMNFKGDNTTASNSNKTEPRYHDVSSNMPPTKTIDGKSAATPLIRG